MAEQPRDDEDPQDAELQEAILQGRRSTRRLVRFGCALLALLIVGAGVIFLYTSSGTGITERGTHRASTAPVGEDRADESSSAATTSPSTTEPAAAEEPVETPRGSREKTFATGETFTVEDQSASDIDLTIGPLDRDATEAVMRGAEGNAAPGPGETYVLVPVEMTVREGAGFEPFLGLSIDYVSSDGFESSNDLALTPKSPAFVGSVESGQTVNWEVALIVPEDQLAEGLIRVRTVSNPSSDPVWVVAG